MLTTMFRRHFARVLIAGASIVGAALAGPISLAVAHDNGTPIFNNPPQPGDPNFVGPPPPPPPTPVMNGNRVQVYDRNGNPLNNSPGIIPHNVQVPLTNSLGQPVNWDGTPLREYNATLMPDGSNLDEIGGISNNGNAKATNGVSAAPGDGQ
jgi:hypothetical protein